MDQPGANSPSSPAAPASPSPPTPPTTPPASPAPSLTPPKKSKRGLWIAVAIIAVVVILAAAFYGTFLGARFAPGLVFKINGPDTLIAGQSAVVSWDTSPENQTRYPSEKIEYCRGRLFGESCTTLNADTTNDGEALVFVPAGLSAGKGYLRLTARDKPAVLGGRLLSNISGTRAITIVTAGENTVSTIGPVTVAGDIVGTISPTGPRVTAARGASHSIELPRPKEAKKIEVCRHTDSGDECQTLVSSATGGVATIQLPANYPTGRAFIKVSERGNDGRLTGNVFYRRAIFVEVSSTEPTPTVEPTPSNDSSSDSNNNASNQSEGLPKTLLNCAYSSQDGFHNFHSVITVAPSESIQIGVGLVRENGQPLADKEIRFGAPDQGTLSTYSGKTSSSGLALVTYTAPSSISPGATPFFAATFPGTDHENRFSSCQVHIKIADTPTPTPAIGGARAEILDPVDGATINGNTLITSVKLTQPPGQQFGCQQWEIDGQVLTSSDWVGGNAPDKSAGPCTSTPYSP